MTSSEWERVDGMIVARELDPQEVAAELAAQGVLAQLEWFENSPQLLGVVALRRGDHAAVVRAPEGTADGADDQDGADSDGRLAEGPTLTELAESLASTFSADVRLGESDADHLPEGASPLAEASDAQAAAGAESAKPSRIVEIGHTPASSVPLLAALEGVDIADLALADGARALLAELPAERSGWNFGELPLVTLAVEGQQFQAFLVTDEHLEHVVSHDWGMRRLHVPDDAPDEVRELVGDRLETDQIAAHVPGADADALFESTRLSGPPAVHAAVRALNLPPEVAGFLLGLSVPEAVPGAQMHFARGISNAIGRSVDIMLKEPDSPSFRLWDAYHTTAVERPWIVHAVASAEAAVGAALLALSVRADSPRSGWTKLGGVIGSILVIDSIAEISLTHYLGRRAERRRAQREEASSEAAG